MLISTMKAYCDLLSQSSLLEYKPAFRLEQHYAQRHNFTSSSNRYNEKVRERERGEEAEKKRKNEARESVGHGRMLVIMKMQISREND